MELELEAIASRMETLDRANLLAVAQKLLRLLEPISQEHGRVRALADLQGQLMRKARGELKAGHEKLVTKHTVGKDAGHCGVCAAYYSLEGVELKP
jgi:hypothetical protein